MLKVVCKGCGAPYRVDERRVPPKGLKMRCPKCGTTFVVHKDQPQETSAAPPGGPPAPPSFRSAQSKRTVLGVGSLQGSPPAPIDAEPVRPSALAGMADLPAPAGLKRPDASPPRAGSNHPDADLPAPAGLKRPGIGLPAPVGLKRPNADLPAPAGLKRPGADLPAPVGLKGPGADLPVPATPKRTREFGTGQPVPHPRGSRPGALEDDNGIPAPPDLDLPAPVVTAPGVSPSPSPFDALDDFGDLPLPITSSGQVDLPTVSGSALDNSNAPHSPLSQDSLAGQSDRQITGAALGFGEPDLPSVQEAGLPSPAGSDFGTQQQGAFGELDLPLAAASLPAVQDPQANLPVHRTAQEDIAPRLEQPALDAAVPMPSAPPFGTAGLAGGSGDNGDFGELSFGPDGDSPDLDASDQSASSPFGVPQSSDAIGSDLDFSDHAAENEEPFGGAFGELDDDPSQPLAGQATGASAGPSALASEEPNEQDAPDSNHQVTRQAGGGTRFGEVDLGDGGEQEESSQLSALESDDSDELGFGDGADDDMEFGAIPQENDEEEIPPSESVGIESGEQTSSSGPDAAPSKTRKSHTVRILLVVLLAVVSGGLALSATPLGAFGMHFIGDALHAKGYAKLLQATIGQTRKALQRDTAGAARTSLHAANQAASNAPRFGPLSAYASYLGFVTELRFGHNAATHAHAVALLKTADIRAKNADFIPLAHAGRDAVEGRLAAARQHLKSIARRRANSIDVAVLEGETELAGQKYKEALLAWQRAQHIEKSARTSFGLARSHFHMGDYKQAKRFARDTLKQVPEHVGARLLLAHIERDTGSVERATNLLKQVLGMDSKDKKIREAASEREVVLAYTMLGEVGLERSRMSESEKQFAEALKLNPKDADALCGFGEVLYRSGRYAEALARFEAGIQADPNSIRAQVGTAKTKIALERLQDAKSILKKLRAAHPSNPDIAYWLALVEKSLGHKSEVETILVDAIGRTPKGRSAIRLHIELSKLLASQGRDEESKKVLKHMREQLPDSAAMYKALGEVAFQAGRLEEAKQLFSSSLKRDPDDLSAMFKLGVTLRRMGRFTEASNKFEQISKVDKSYPGLALEKGVLFEASGQSQRALEMYQEALSKAPNDPDLMLRVGSAEVAAGHVSQAEQILRKVLRERPNSAEANHYLGRALLVKGTNLAEALRFLSRASEIDPNRAQYWLYIGWAANDAGQPDTARSALKKALKLDQSLADAYWQRGVLLRRQGAVRDAEKDLRKALELKPSRFEAYATLAECFEDESKWDASISAWKKAIGADGNRPFWHYKLGRLYYTSRRHGPANEQLRQAVQLAKKAGRKPWLWEAYYMLGSVNQKVGKRKDAIKFYRDFLGLAPPDTPYRRDALRSLDTLGAPYD